MPSLSAELDEVMGGLNDERKKLRTLADQTQRKLEALKAQVVEREGQVMPPEVTGIIRNYRYGVNGDEIGHPDGRKKMPTHSFDLEVGSGVWLHTVLGSEQWDPFVMTCDGTISDALLEAGGSAEKVWNGKRIAIEYQEVIARYVPVRIMGTKVLGQDRNDRPVYQGDRVRILDGSGTEGEVRFYSPSKATYEVRREDGSPGGGRYDEDYGTDLYLVSASQLELK